MVHFKLLSILGWSTLFENVQAHLLQIIQIRYYECQGKQTQAILETDIYFHWNKVHSIQYSIDDS